MRLREFAPSPERDHNDDVPDPIFVLANRWWNATDRQPQIEHVLNSLGWSIHQVESEDDAVQLQHRDGTTHFISADDFDPDLFEYQEPKIHRANRDGIDLSFEKVKDDEYVDDNDDENTVIYVKAASNGKELGHVLFSIDGDTLLPQDLEVDDRYRGQGIAKIMYDYVKSLGYQIRRSGQQTDAGAGFWGKHRPGVNVWEAKVNEISDELRRNYLHRATGIMESVEAYHGTFQPTLTNFKPLSHFGTLQAAEDRLKEKARREKIKTPGRVYEVVLDIKNPFVAKDFAGVHSPTHFAFDLKDRKLISQEEMVAITHLAGDPRQAQALIKKLRELGFDSIAYKNKYEDKGSTSYVILDPSQVVSVNPVERQAIAEARMPAEVEDFLYSLSPDDAGVDEVGPYRIHYEGFTDDCQSSADYCENPEAVYNQVFADHIAREGGRKPVEQNFTGDEDYPILYSIFKIPRQVKEIARIPQSELGGWGDKDTLEPMTKPPKNRKPLPGGSGLTYAVNKKDPEFLEIMIFDGDTLAAELDLFATLDPLKTWRVETVVTDPDYRGRGMGKALYGIALSILKLTIEAGEQQTKFGQAMWLMLDSIPGVEVLGYTMEYTDRYRPKPGDKIVDQNDTWTRYTFPVEPGRRSMRSTRPGTGIYSSQHVSMIAKWTGR